MSAFSISGLISIIAAGSFWQKPVVPVEEMRCVLPEAQTGDFCWVARLDNCGSCDEQGTNFGCPTYQKVDGLYQRLENSRVQHCPQAKGCIDLVRCSECLADPDLNFERFDKELNDSCKQS